MHNFKYRARDNFGKAVTGVMKADDKAQVASHISAMGYVPVSIEEASELEFALPKLFAVFDRVTLMDINIFTRQLYTLTKAGVPLISGLETIERQTRNKPLRNIIKELVVDIERGTSLSSALTKYPRVFNEFYVNMVKAGEASGLMDEILARLIEFGEIEMDTRIKVKAAVRYPIITLCAMALAFLVLVTFVIPKFAAIFGQFKATLPLPTRVLLGLSYIIEHYWYLAAIVVALIIFAFNKYINTKKGRLIWDTFKLKVPVFGPLISMFVMSRVTRAMAILIKSGLPILQVLEMAAHIAGNSVIAKALDRISASAREGKGISGPMNASGVFPPIVINMVTIGEETGKVDELLLSVSDYYDQQSDYLMKNLTAILEPVFIGVLGGMVLTMALAIFLPMWNLITLFKH